MGADVPEGKFDPNKLNEGPWGGRTFKKHRATRGVTKSVTIQEERRALCHLNRLEI